VVPTWSLRDGERTKDNNSSISMSSPRLSETTTGDNIASISKVTETATILEQSQASAQDGGKCSD
jgi:hypothetical protein